MSTMLEMTLVGSITGLLVGLGAGAVAGSIKSQRIKTRTEEAAMLLPQSVANVDDFKTSLLALASGARITATSAFTAVVDKLARMLHVAELLEAADPATVQPALANIGAQFMESLCDKLYRYYNAAGVTVVKVKNTDLREVGAFELQPIQRDMKLAHQVLVAAAQCLADAMQATASQKLLEAFTNR